MVIYYIFSSFSTFLLSLVWYSGSSLRTSTPSHLSLLFLNFKTPMLELHFIHKQISLQDKIRPCYKITNTDFVLSYISCWELVKILLRLNLSLVVYVFDSLKPKPILSVHQVIQILTDHRVSLPTDVITPKTYILTPELRLSFDNFVNIRPSPF